MLAIGSVSGPAVAGAGIGFLSTPLLVAWFPPVQFGSVAYTLAAASILSSITSLRLEVVLYRVAGSQRRAVAWQATLVSVAIASLLLVAALPLAAYAAGWDWSAGATEAIVIYLMLVAICIANIGVAFLTAERRYLAAGLPRLISPIAILVTAAAIRLVPGLHGAQLVLANVLALVVAAAMYLAAFVGRLDAGTLRSAVDLVVRHRRHIVFAAPQNSIAVAGFLNFGMLLISFLCGKAAAGEVFMAFRLVGFPSTVLGVAASNFIMAESRDQAPERLRGYALAMAAGGLLIYAPVLLAVLAIPVTWLPLEWRGALAVLPPMMLLCFTHFVVGSFGQVLLVRDRAGQMLAWEIARLTIPSLLLFAAWWLGSGYVAALWLFVVAQIPLYLLLARLVWRAAASGRAPPVE